MIKRFDNKIQALNGTQLDYANKIDDSKILRIPNNLVPTFYLYLQFSNANGYVKYPDGITEEIDETNTWIRYNHTNNISGDTMIIVYDENKFQGLTGIQINNQSPESIRFDLSQLHNVPSLMRLELNDYVKGDISKVNVSNVYRLKLVDDFYDNTTLYGNLDGLGANLLEYISVGSTRQITTDITNKINWDAVTYLSMYNAGFVFDVSQIPNTVPNLTKVSLPLGTYGLFSFSGKSFIKLTSFGMQGAGNDVTVNVSDLNATTCPALTSFSANSSCPILEGELNPTGLNIKSLVFRYAVHPHLTGDISNFIYSGTTATILTDSQIQGDLSAYAPLTDISTLYYLGIELQYTRVITYTKQGAFYPKRLKWYNCKSNRYADWVSGTDRDGSDITEESLATLLDDIRLAGTMEGYFKLDIDNPAITNTYYNALDCLELLTTPTDEQVSSGIYAGEYGRGHTIYINT